MTTTEEELAERLWDAGLQPKAASEAARALAAEVHSSGWVGPHTLAPGVVFFVYGTERAGADTPTRHHQEGTPR